MVTGHYPTTLNEAVTILEECPDSLIINGGTDVMVVKKEAAHIIFLNQIEALKQVIEIKNEDTYKTVLRIGAGATYYQLIQNPLVPDILKRAMSQIASPAIRHMGTLVGNICNASPAGDTLPVLYALSAQIVIASKKNESIIMRKMPIAQFIKGIRKIDLKSKELVTAVEIDKSEYELVNHIMYEKVGARKSEAISKLSFVGLAEVEEDTLKAIKIAFGSVSITVVRRKELETELINQNINVVKSQKESIAKKYLPFITPIDDQRSTAQYRKTVCMNLLKDFLGQL